MIKREMKNLGRFLRAVAKAVIAKLFLPDVFAASSSTASAMRVSVQPPPYTVKGSRTAVTRTQRAS